MGHVFIRHVEEDGAPALELSAALEAEGYSTWCYETDSVPGCSYLLQTGSAIDRADAVIVLISEHSLSSHQVTAEVVRAYERNRPVVPLLLGVSHALFQRRQPEWRQAIGAAASLRLDREDVRVAASAGSYRVCAPWASRRLIRLTAQSASSRPSAARSPL